MRVAALYDIHGNLPALEAVMAAVRQANVDQIVIGGDVVPGPLPRETLAYLLALDIPTHFIRGNGDDEILAQMRGTTTGQVPEHLRESVRWVAQQLQPDYESVFAQWPLTYRLEMPGIGGVLFCHATPRNNTEIFTRLTPDAALLPVFAGIDVSLVVCGHTHMQFDRTINEIRVVNSGSVGMTYGEPGACWLLLDDDVHFQRTPYDLAAAADRIRASGYPSAQDYADNNVLQRPSAEEAVKRFTEMGLK